MGETLTLKFPNKTIRDRMFSFVQDHLLTLEFTEKDLQNIAVGKISTLKCIYVEKAKGNKITFDYPAWFGGPYRLWLEVFVKWTSFTAGIKKNKVEDKTFDPPIPVIHADSIGWHALEFKKPTKLLQLY